MYKSRQPTLTRRESQNFLSKANPKAPSASDFIVIQANDLEETVKESSALNPNQSSSSLSSSISNSSSIIPGPNDSIGLDSSAESTSLKKIKSNNEILCKAVKDKLQEFRVLNKKSRNEGVKVVKELKFCQIELKDMKESVVEIIDEAHLTKEQILKMKEKLEIENKENDSLRFEECDMGSARIPEQSCFLVEQIKELHQEIWKIHNRIERSEEELRNKEDENRQLKGLIEKLNMSFDKITVEPQGKRCGCSNCDIF